MTVSKHAELAARLLHHGEERLKPGDPIAPPIVPAATFHLPGIPGNAPFHYGREGNPTWEWLEGALSLLEEAPAIVFPSGMAAISALFYTLLEAGDKILVPSDGYYTTRSLLKASLEPLGITAVTRPIATFAQGGFEGFRLVLVETPSNPGLDICDIATVARACKVAGAILAADNTTMTPLGQRPLDLGADIVVSSDTKAINGHSDALYGHIATLDGALLARLKEWRKLAGAIPGPFETWLVARGLETLEVRFERMCTTAAVIAERLQAHPKFVSVRYPGLRDHPAYAIASRQMMAPGFMIAATLKDAAAADRFIGECPLIQPATSFGGVRTSAERRARWGDAVPEGFVRMSIGLEPAEVLWRAMSETLDAHDL